MRKPHAFVLFGLVAILIGSCGPAQSAGQPIQRVVVSPESSEAYWPTEGWRTSAPEEQGMDSETLAEMLKAIGDQGHDIDSVTVIRNGTMVADATVYPFQPDSRHIIHSCTKSIVSALIGIAIDKGYIEGVDQPIIEFFPGRSVANLDADKRAMTLEHVLMMAGGWECRDSYLYRWRGLHEMMESQDWVGHMLDLPMVEKPGTRFEYCNGGSFLLSAIIQETTGLSALAFAEKHLFGPLGISDVDWPSNPQGISIGWGEMHMRPHDMAKIGYLYLREGEWDGEQVVPADWVAASTRKRIDAMTLQDGYGYQWWVAEGGVYMALGYAGQYIVVVPERDMVVVFTSQLEERDFYMPQRLLDDFIIPAAKSPAPLPANPNGVASLEAAIRDLATPPTTTGPLDSGAVEPEPTEKPAARPAAEDSAALEVLSLSPAIAEAVAELEGLPLDRFFEESYRQLLLRYPEELTRLGIAQNMGLRNDQLNNLSDGYVRETQELEVAILGLLRTYDRAELPPEQQVSYDVYEWYLDDRIRGHEFMYYDYPLHHFIGSYHDELVRLLTEIHPIGSRQDAEDYVSRVSQVDDQIAQLLEGLRLREEAGVIPPKFIVEMTASGIEEYLGAPNPASISGKSLSVYTAFRDKLEELDGLSAEETRVLESDALAEIESSFIPAYVELLDYLDYLATIATDDAGVWKFPRGDDYYAYILRNQTSTDLTPEEVHELGLAEVARIQAEMRQVFDALGYPQDKSLGELLDRASRQGGSYEIGTQAGKDQLMAAYEAIIEEVDSRLEEAFDVRPQAQVVVVGGPIGGYYVPGSIDGSRPGAFHVGTEGYRVPKLNMASLTYHEAIPGHHFQIALAQELDLPLFRNDVFFNGYAEGWALYAERLAWEMGLYDDDPYGNLGRLDYELLRAARLVVDTGIHALRWTREEANAAMAEAFGAPPGKTFYEVDRYIVRPAQATGYKVGMLKILELRQMAMDRLGDQFDLKEFHNVVVGNGSMPLNTLEQVVVDYVNDKLARPGEAVASDLGEVEGWAVLAEKDDYGDVEMGNLPVDYIGIAQMRQMLEDLGWEPGYIHDLREFDREMLRADLDWLAERADKDDVVLVYVAAHGSYLRDVLAWSDFFATDWEQVPSQRRLLIIDSCQAANYTGAIADDPMPYLSLAAVAGDEYAWSGLEEEGLPIIGGVFTHYFAAAFGEPEADVDGDGFVSAQEAALLAEEQQRIYMHEVVFAVPEFLEMYRNIGVSPDQDPTFPDVVVDDTIGEPLHLALDAYR